MEFGAELSKSLVVQRRYSGAGTGLLAKHRNPRFLSQNSTARSTAGQFCTGDRTLLLEFKKILRAFIATCSKTESWNQLLLLCVWISAADRQEGRVG